MDFLNELARNRWLVALGILGAAVIAGVQLAPNRGISPTGDGLEVSMAVEETLGMLTVHVSGWVLHPGVVQVEGGALVADAVVAAGGARPGAALDRINLAEPVGAGDQVHVPGPGSASEWPETRSDGLVDLNHADPAELESLPGVGPVLADRIVAHRQANGDFDEISDLLDVPGIGEAKLASLEDLVTIR